jgi:hypothetical protein
MAVSDQVDADASTAMTFQWAIFRLPNMRQLTSTHNQTANARRVITEYENYSHPWWILVALFCWSDNSLVASTLRIPPGCHTGSRSRL